LDDDGFDRAHHHAALTAHAFFAGRFGFAVNQGQDFGRAGFYAFTAADAFVLVNCYDEHSFSPPPMSMSAGDGDRQKKMRHRKPMLIFCLVWCGFCFGEYGKKRTLFI